MEIRLKKVRALFRKARAGDKAAIADLEFIMAALVRSAQDVIDNWEAGDLVAAVNLLNDVLRYAEGIKQ